MAQLPLWGVFKAEQVHVLPCNEEGDPLYDHIPSPDCWCEPTLEPESLGDDYPTTLWIH